jgi:hypothetical protein
MDSASMEIAALKIRCPAGGVSEQLVPGIPQFGRPYFRMTLNGFKFTEKQKV